MTAQTSTGVDGGFRPCPSDDATLLNVGGQSVVFHRRSRAAHALNETAGVLWQVLDCEGSISDIAADVADVFGIAVSEAIEGLTTLVDQLGQIGVLEGVDARHAADPVASDDCDDDEPAQRDPFSEPPYVAVPPNN